MIPSTIANGIGIVLILLYILDFAYHFVKNIHGFNSVDKKITVKVNHWHIRYKNNFLGLL